MEKLVPTISHIWQVFVTTNMFNFTIFVLAFAWIFKKFDIAGMLDSVKQKIVEMLEVAKKNKAAAHKELKDAEKAIENLGEELKTISIEAEKSAEKIGEKFLNEAKSQAINIEANAVKVVEAEEKRLVSTLTSKTSKASIQVAKSNIETALAQNPNLHEKYINESIDSLDRLNF